jgi:hypothetical protein
MIYRNSPFCERHGQEALLPISMQFLLVMELDVNVPSFNYYSAGTHVHDSSMHLVLKGRCKMFSLLDEYLVCRGWKDLWNQKSHNKLMLNLHLLSARKDNHSPCILTQVYSVFLDLLMLVPVS